MTIIAALSNDLSKGFCYDNYFINILYEVTIQQFMSASSYKYFKEKIFQAQNIILITFSIVIRLIAFTKFYTKFLNLSTNQMGELNHGWVMGRSVPIMLEILPIILLRIFQNFTH